MSLLVRRIEELAASKPNRLAWVVDSRGVSYGDLFRRAGAIAAALTQRGVKPGAVIAFQLPNSIDALLLHIAVSWTGGILLPLNPAFRHRELTLALQESRPRLLFVSDVITEAQSVRRLAAEHGIELLTTGRDIKHADSIAALESAGLSTQIPRVFQRGKRDPAVILYTSGTASAPKGIVHCEEALWFDATSMISADAIVEEDILFSPASVSHVAGIIFLLYLPFVRGNLACTQQRWNPEEALTMMAHYRCTWAAGATPFLQGLVQSMERKASGGVKLRAFRCGGASVSPALIQRARQLGIAAYRSYGCSEHPTIAGRATDPEDHAMLSDGSVHDHVMLRIVDIVTGDDVASGDPGEIITKGADQFLEYTDPIHNIGARDADCWLHTGDVGTLNSLGFLTLVGRKTDLIIRKGENISAKEIEDIVAEHPAVQEVTIVGVQDSERGEIVCAVVVLREANGLDLASLLRHLEVAGLARYKWPERLEVVESLPRNATGKVLKDAVRNRIQRVATA